MGLVMFSCMTVNYWNIDNLHYKNQQLSFCVWHAPNSVLKLGAHSKFTELTEDFPTSKNSIVVALMCVQFCKYNISHIAE